ncbi:MAG: glycosyltransferase family 4 protein [Sideroxyarcus sp.]|nr:glycosyltransferase family 4 protein [Sideroxyarcus sp.]
MKKNILIIGNYPPPYGGVPHHIERLTEYLVDKGWTCHVLSGGTSGNQHIGALHIYKPTYPAKLLGYLRQGFNRKFRRWLGTASLDKYEPAFWRRYKMYSDVGEKIVRENDIQLVASYNLLTYGPVGAYLADQFRLPHVVNVFGEVYKYDSMLRHKSFFAHVVKSAYRLLSCSSHCGQSIRQLGVETPVQTVTYGVNIGHFTPGEAKDLRTSLGIGSAPVVLFVGRLGREMGLDSFFAAARLTAQSFPDVRFVMVGQTGDLADEIEKKCETSDGRYILRRNSPYTDLPNYYRMASIVVVPTRGDRTCSSLAAMEAMATRKAVVGFAIGGIPEIVEHEKTGLLVDPEKIEALSGAINRLLEDELLRVSLAEAGYRKSQSSFDENQVNVTMERHFLDALRVA